MKRLVTPRRGAFTLVELLVVMAIIAMLAAMTLGVVDAARRTARQQSSEMLVEKINGVVIDQCESYATRRVAINPDLVNAINDDEEKTWSEAQNNARKVQRLAYCRVFAIREVMRMEMPECWDDVTDSPRTMNLKDKNGNPISVPVIRGNREPALYKSYNARLTGNQTDQYESAECLYLFVTMAHPELRKRFRDEEIGDADEDGFFEFQDAWGNPIKFLRWAPAICESDFQKVVAEVDTNATFDAYTMQEIGTGNDPVGDNIADAQENDSDPLDLLQVEHSDVWSFSPSWRLFPLVYSAGADGIYDIIERSDLAANLEQKGSSCYLYTGTGYVRSEVGLAADLPSDSITDPGPRNEELNHYDNIHNHRANP
jgi:prepilin-type N-terminal cleavage/methylation domain-containing protein